MLVNPAADGFGNAHTLGERDVPAHLEVRRWGVHGSVARHEQAHDSRRRARLRDPHQLDAAAIWQPKVAVIVVAPDEKAGFFRELLKGWQQCLDVHCQ